MSGGCVSVSVNELDKIFVGASYKISCYIAMVQIYDVSSSASRVHVQSQKYFPNEKLLVL